MKGRAASLGAAPAAVRVFLEHKQAKFNQRVQPSDCAIMQPPPSAVPTPASATQATASTTGRPPEAPAASEPVARGGQPPHTVVAAPSTDPPASLSPPGSSVPPPSSSSTPASTAPPASAAPAHPAATSRPRVSPRIAKRKLTEEALAEARRQKRKLVVNQEAATAAAARSSAVALGASSSASASPAATASTITTPQRALTTPPRAAPASTAHRRPTSKKTTSKTTKPTKTTQRPAFSRPSPPSMTDSAPVVPPAVTAGGTAVPPCAAQVAGPTTIVPATQPTASAPVVAPTDAHVPGSAPSVLPPPPSRVAARPEAAHDLEPAAARASRPLARTSVPPILHSGPAVATADSAFDLVDFMTSFNSGADTATPALQPPSHQASYPPPVAQEYSPGLNHRSDSPPTADPVPQHPSMAQLFAEIMQYLQSRQPVSALAAPVAAPPTVPPYGAATAIDAQPDPQSWTVPNNRGSLPPAPVRNLRAAHFPPPAKMTRARGDFVPSAVHNLAAHRLYPYLLSAEGVYETPMSFVLRMRMLDCLNFDDNAPILNATSAARFGRYGVSIMHYHRANRAAQLAAGSSDANFNLDFGINASPPPAPPCDTYFDLLCAIQGLTTFANSQWHDVMARPLYRLREFVVANMDVDPPHTPARVERTLHEVNHHLGAVYVHLSSDSPFWWREFSAAASRIDFGTVAWAMALQAIPIATAAPAAPARRSGPSGNPNTQTARPTQRGEADRVQPTRPGGLPASVRALIPRAAGGVEPCLRFFGGGMCFGGTRDQCAIEGRAHTWLDDLPPALVAFITKQYGRRRQSTRQRN
ncbi:hypothetical protein PF010_g25075 [Phytophthora fragariae]|uniref:Uncharacterized protein n=1 Tax=Phytophthora fragariae TaxID=53985 RepID=A0A6G0K0R7_9STRA|nr:hypothetical protein PF010_g25075 [Phytophthora fragariae]